MGHAANTQGPMIKGVSDTVGPLGILADKKPPREIPRRKKSGF